MASSTKTDDATADLDVRIALGRFGLGPRPGEWRTLAKDPRQFVLSQCEVAPDKAFPASGLPTSVEILDNVRTVRLAAREARRAAKAQAANAGTPAMDAAGAPQTDGAPPADGTKAAAAPAPDGAVDPAIKEQVRNAYRNEVGYRYNTAVASDHPFLERLVMFWSNHFAVSVRRSMEVRCTAGAYEREAIRPHILGRFRDMLGAVATHPTMLGYLDNDVSLGPNSKVGLARKRGLNENFARELLELHTVGVDGGYTQADVTSLAKVLTGWRSQSTVGNSPGAFRFDPARHEPGAFTVLGRTYPEGGMEQGQAVLDDLASRPETARHLARKLVRHFVGDTAPPAIAAGVAQAFMATDGNLAETVRALVNHPASWDAPPAKILPPYDMIVAVSRAMSEGLPLTRVLLDCRKLGQPLWEPRAPIGYDDGDSTWAAPEGISTRLDFAMAYAAIADKAGVDIPGFANDLYGPTLSAETLTTLQRAESRNQSLVLLMMSPEVLKR